MQQGEQKMPRGKVPSMLSVNNGNIISVEILRVSKCYRCKQQLPNGTKCGELKTMRGGFTNHKRLCLECAKAIILLTQQELNKIKKLFNINE